MPAPALDAFVSGLPADGSFSVWAAPLAGDVVVAHRADEQHYAASTMKVALVAAAYRASDDVTLDLDARVPIHDDFESAIGGQRFRMDRDEDSDQDTWARMGESVAIRWLAHRAIVRSGNLATNLVLEQVGLPAVDRTLAAIGTRRTVIARGIEDAPAREAGRHNLVTAGDLGSTLQAIASGRIASEASSRILLDTLLAQQVNDAIPAGLPAGTRVAHKSGWVTGVSHDAGIVFPDDAAPFVLAVCTTSELSEQDSLALIAAAAAASWEDRHTLGGAR